MPANELSGALFFPALLGYALCLMLLVPKLRPGPALLSAYCGMLFASFYGVILLQIMVPAAYALMLGGLGALAAGIAGLCANWRGLRTRVLSSGCLVYVLGAFACILLTRGMQITAHDDLSYWARAAKELFTYDRFYIHMDSTMFHTDYIPLFASLQYCVTRVFGWQEAYLAYVTFAGVLASLCALADMTPSKGWGFALASLLAYGFTVYGFTYFQLRADGPMCMLFVAALLCLYAREGDDTAALLPTVSAAAILPGVKIYSGLLFGVVLAACLLWEGRRTSRSAKARGARSGRASRWAGSAALALIALLQLSWSGLYHHASAVAAYENASAVAAFTGEAFSGVRPVFSLADLFSGNPRNTALWNAFTPENLRYVGGLISDTLSSYLHSALPYALLFMLSLLLVRDRNSRSRVAGSLAATLSASLLYLIGLFGSYFVQAETSGAALNYLNTASTPIVLVSLFYAVRAASGGRLKRRGLLLTALMTAGLLVLTPPAQWASRLTVQTSDSNASALAREFFNEEIADQIEPQDAERHAMLIDCTYEASQIKSESGKTHAYHYYGAPLRLHVWQYPYGNYDALDFIDQEALWQALNQNRCELLILRVEDELYWDALRDALELEDSAEPIAVYDVRRENGAISLKQRASQSEAGREE